jgi:hypothetical protein
MRSEIKKTEWLGRIGRSPAFSGYLNVALLLFLLSLFILDSSKYRNNIYYALFAFPALVFAVAAVWRKIFGPGVVLLLVYFLGALGAHWLAGDEVAGLFKHQIYLMMLLCGLMLCIEQPVYFRRAALVYAAICVVFTGLAFYKWQDMYLSTGVFPRIGLFGAAANPVHASLMILTGWLGFWMVFGLPRLLERGRFAYLAGLGLMLGVGFIVCLVFQSRSALLGLLAATGGWLILGRERGLSLLLVGGLAALLVAMGSYEALLARGGSYRVDIWNDAFMRLYESCSWVVGCAQEENFRYLGKFHHAHSAYVSILVDTGLIGAATFVSFAGLYLILGVKTRSPWFIVSLVGWAGVIASSNGLVDSPRPLWVYFWLPTLLALLDYQRPCATQRTAAS